MLMCINGHQSRCELDEGRLDHGTIALSDRSMLNYVLLHVFLDFTEFCYGAGTAM